MFSRGAMYYGGVLLFSRDSLDSLLEAMSQKLSSNEGERIFKKHEYTVNLSLERWNGMAGSRRRVNKSSR